MSSGSFALECEKLAGALGIAVDAPFDAPVFSFSIGETRSDPAPLSVVLKAHENDNLLIETDLGAVPEQQRRRVYADLMAASLFPADLDLCYGFDKQNGTVKLSAVVAYADLDAKPLVGFVTRFLELAREQRAGFEKKSEDTSVYGEQSGSDFPTQMFFDPRYFA